MTDWSICASDDEWSIYDDDSAKSNRSEPPISERLAKLFPEIKEKNVLPLYNCHCPRKGKEQLKQPPVISPIQQVPIKEEKMNSLLHKDQSTDHNKTLEAFDFDDDNEKPSTKRKVTVGVKRVKKEKATMSNVMNDLLRHKLLDELEAKKNDDATKEQVKDAI